MARQGERTIIVMIAALALAGSLAFAPRSFGQGTPSPDDKLSLAVVQAICPNQVRTEALKNGTAYGCGSCPAFTSFHSDPPSRGRQPDFELRKVLTGSFTRAGSKEVLAEFYGCEPHVYNFGGTLVLDQSGPKLKRVRYVQGIIGLVRTYALTSGRDIVLSQAGYTGQGISTDGVSTYDFSKTDPSEHNLLRVEDDSGNACQSTRVTIASISKLEFPDLNGDGRPDLRVTVESGEATVPARFRGHCEEEFKTPQVPTYTVDFLFDGTTFHVTAATAAAWRRVNAKEE